ncbi:hypothetical protein SOVF_168800, partial [Spinacia oleracea]
EWRFHCQVFGGKLVV